MIKLISIISVFILIENGCVCFNIQTKLTTMLKPLITEVDLDSPINFGVSLSSLEKKENSTILFAGAPAADLGDYREQPGSIFNCDLNKKSDRFDEDYLNNKETTKNQNINCKPIVLMKNRNKSINLTNHMQLGSSVLSSNDGNFAFCAAGALNPKFRDHYPNGQCWFGNYRPLSNPSFKNDSIYLNNLIHIDPLNDEKKQIDFKTYFRSHGMFGFSSKQSKNDTRTIFYGAPGFFEWRGAVVHVKTPQNKNGPKMINLYHRIDFSPYSYFGFSVTFARLNKDRKLFCVASAPRAKTTTKSPDTSSTKSTGAVAIFEPSAFNKTISEIQIRKPKILYGTKNGEYFGCGLEAIDLNNDGLDDLIIGSPFYSMSNKELMDNGAVYIYMSNENDFEEPVMLFGSGESNSMFGYSIASADDLDQDGYQDFVVGAPYEHDSGCIYIYNGRKESPPSAYSQRICANQFSQTYRGFGIKIHGSFDVDSNKYPDLAIGAYLSKNVLILRSRPVAHLKTIFNLNVTNINLNDKSAFCSNDRNRQRSFCFELTICQNLSIRHPEHLEDQLINTTLQLDVFRFANSLNHSIYAPSISSSRAYFELNSVYQPKYKKFFVSNSSNTNKFSFLHKLRPNRLYCHEPFLILLRNDIEDKLKPILMLLTHSLSKKEDCVQNCPVLLNENQETMESIAFHTGCKESECVSKLILDLNLKTQQNYDKPTETELIEMKELLIGYHQYSILNVRLINQGEQAYSTYLKLIVKPSLQIKRIESCKQVNSTDETSTDPKNSGSQQIEGTYLEIICNLGNPVEKGSLDLNIRFDFFNTELNSQSFTIDASVQTKSKLTADSVIRKTINIPLRRRVSFALKDTQQTTNTILHDFKSKNESIDKITFSNYFQMIKNDSSNIPLLDLLIHVPTYYNNLTLVNDINIESLDGTTLLPCYQMNSDANPNELDTELTYRNQEIRKKELKILSNKKENEEFESTTEESIEESKLPNDDLTHSDVSNDNATATDSNRKIENLWFSNGQLNFNCETMKCTKFNCSIKSIGFSKQIRLFNLTASIDLKNLDLVIHGLKNFSQVQLKTDLKLSIPESLIELYEEESFNSNISLSVMHSVYVTIKQIPGQEKLAFWIIVASVLAGLFLLFILIVSLIKCGFFKRTKRDEIRRFKQKQRETLLLLNPMPQIHG